MKKFLSSKALMTAAGVLGTCAAFAEGETSGVAATLVTPYITDGKTQIIAVLTAGAVIVGAFFVWRLIKKALNASK